MTSVHNAMTIFQVSNLNATIGSSFAACARIDAEKYSHAGRHNQPCRNRPTLIDEGIPISKVTVRAMATPNNTPRMPP